MQQIQTRVKKSLTFKFYVIIPWKQKLSIFDIIDRENVDFDLSPILEVRKWPNFSLEL